ADIQPLIEHLKTTYSTPELLISTYFPEVIIYFAPYGLMIKEGDTLITNHEYPSPFGGRNIPFNGQIELEKNNNEITLIKSIEVADSSIGEVFRETLGQIPDFDLRIETIYSYNESQSIITKVRQEKYVEINEDRQVKTLEINILD
ncbi:MAG: hypothetical protein AAF740_09305, partial [Bacteroidota bacterium]